MEVPCYPCMVGICTVILTDIWWSRWCWWIRYSLIYIIAYCSSHTFSLLSYHQHSQHHQPTNLSSFNLLANYPTPKWKSRTFSQLCCRSPMPPRTSTSKTCRILPALPAFPSVLTNWHSYSDTNCQNWIGQKNIGQGWGEQSFASPQGSHSALPVEVDGAYSESCIPFSFFPYFKRLLTEITRGPVLR